MSSSSPLLLLLPLRACLMETPSRGAPSNDPSSLPSSRRRICSNCLPSADNVDDVELLELSADDLVDVVEWRLSVALLLVVVVVVLLPVVEPSSGGEPPETEEGDANKPLCIRSGSEEDDADE